MNGFNQQNVFIALFATVITLVALFTYNYRESWRQYYEYRCEYKLVAPGAPSYQSGIVCQGKEAK